MTVPFIQELVPKYDFANARTFISLSRGAFLVVQNPEKTSDFSNIKGQIVRIGGDLYRVIGVDRNSHCPPWHVGEEIGLQVEYVK